METASWAIVAFTFVLMITTIVYTVMTRRLWQQTKRSYELSLFLHFIEFIKQSKGAQKKPGRPVHVQLNQKLYHPKHLFGILNKAFPEEFKRFNELFELDKEI